MTGTLSGGKKASLVNKSRHGEDFYKRIGKIGGSRKVPKGFAAMSREKRVEAGRIGGTKSRRLKGNKNKNENNN